MASFSTLALLEPDGAQILEEGRVYRRLGSEGVWRRIALRAGRLYIRHGDGPSAPQDEILSPAGSVLRLGRRVLLVATLQEQREGLHLFDWQGFGVRSLKSQAFLCRLASAAFSDAPLCLQGESGSGKELAARALHQAGPRAHAPFVALNCAALPESLAEAELFGVARGAYTGAHAARQGAFSRAHGGTLFLDEVGELPLSVQAKLLRALESGEALALGAVKPVRFDVRVVSATWRDLEGALAQGRFRFDLLQRLAVLDVRLPSLRERPEDIAPLLWMNLKARDALDLWPKPALLEALIAAPWLGNVRELRNRVERASLWGDPEALLPSARGHRVQSSGGLKESGSDPIFIGKKRGYLEQAIAKSSGNRAAAARALGVSRSTLYRWLNTDTLQESGLR